ncbi:MAG: class II fructose-bisphosphate aldolase [Atopobiaceae bacterium]|nr:class II fructose-bisphosphate aldolase [Atopobiaceae bacterium]
MLVNLRDICAIAEQNNLAIGSFNAPSFEAVRATLDAAEQTGYPVILSHAEGHDSMAPLDKIGPTMVALAERSSALVCVHLDHCENLSYMRRALEMGFTGAMFDGSYLPYDENVANSQRAADMCANYDCGLECELGSMGAREAGERDEGGTAEESGAIYTDPDQAAAFIEETGLDILACSFGTVHGIYKGEPHLSFDVLREIRERANVPLVMHGGSGVSDDDYHKAIDAGIRKINYFTYGSMFAGEAAQKCIADKRVDNPDALVYWHNMTMAAYERYLEVTIETMKVFANGAKPVA